MRAPGGRWAREPLWAPASGTVPVVVAARYEASVRSAAAAMNLVKGSP